MWATAVSSALFGLWHVMSSLSGAAAEGGAREGAAGRAAAVVGTVLFTGAAGVLLCELRRRSGSLASPALLHWAANGIGVLASAYAWSLAG